MADPKYITDNTDGSLLTFNKRVVYDVASDEDRTEYENLVDFNFGEKFLYGRVTKNFVPIVADAERLAGMKTLNGALLGTSQEIAFDFVVDAFKDLQFQFDKKVADGKLSPDHEFLSSLKIYKAYVDPYDLFNEHQDKYTGQIKQHFKEKNIQVKNFSEFISHFMELMKKSAHSSPFTFSAFMKSKYCPINASGLAIEIADEDYFDDSKKIDLFINSEAWLFFLNACKSYGFSVDKNIPWRIVADVGSTEMINYSRNYGIVSTQSLISFYYERTDNVFFKKFRDYLHMLYKSVIVKQIPVLENCNGVTIRKYITPETYSRVELARIFNNHKLLKLLFEIRILEEGKVFKESEKARIFKDCLAINQIHSSKKALFAFETVINHPFDYNGSLSYLLERTRKGYGDKIVFSEPG